MLPRPANLLAEVDQTPRIARHGVVAEGALQHSQSVSGQAARLLNDPQRFNRSGCARAIAGSSDEASNGRLALQLALQQPPDVPLLDLGLPGGRRQSSCPVHPA
jgi:CheY-like chemotaxis protein